MRPRQAIADHFSSFLQFEADRFAGWLVDVRLQRSMQRSLEQAGAAKASENYWALYWHKSWQTQPAGLARQHLAAYVQEPCYWAAQKTTLHFASTQYTLADCFQMAIAQLDKILKGFDSQQGFRFKSYASATCHSLIREGLRQRQEIDICTDWALLRKISQKRLLEALQNVGLPSQTVQSYILAWTTFKTLYVPQQATATRQLAKPEPQVWQAIAQQYRATATGASVSPEELEKWLTICARAARAYLYPSHVSINAPRSGEEAGEFLDSLPDQTQPSLLQALISDEEFQARQTQHAQVSELLQQAIANLDDESRTILELYYRDRCTQQQMAAALNTKQYTISRRLTRAREHLLRTLAHWVKETLHISPTSDILSHTSNALEEWLTSHFSEGC